MTPIPVTPAKCVVPWCKAAAVEGGEGLCEVHFGQYEDTLYEVDND